VFEVQIYNKKM